LNLLPIELHDEIEPEVKSPSRRGKKGRKGVCGGGARRGWSHCRQTSVENRLEEEEEEEDEEEEEENDDNELGWMQTVSRMPRAIEMGRG
jgi:hypothetical protein